MKTTAFILSENRSDTARPMPPKWIVIHDTESPETTGRARSVAQMFQPEAADKSAHVVVDNKDIIRCVPDQYQAYAALGGNVQGLHIEIVGTAAQGAKGWADDYSQAALRNAAAVAATWADVYGIPVRKLSSADVKAGKRGICGHINITEAFKQSTHTDPGPTFPWDQFIQMVQGDDDMALSDDDVKRIAKATADEIFTRTFGTLVNTSKLNVVNFLQYIHKNTAPKQ